MWLAQCVKDDSHSSLFCPFLSLFSLHNNGVNVTGLLHHSWLSAFSMTDLFIKKVWRKSHASVPVLWCDQSFDIQPHKRASSYFHSQWSISWLLWLLFDLALYFWGCDFWCWSLFELWSMQPWIVMTLRWKLPCSTPVVQSSCFASVFSFQAMNSFRKRVYQVK